MRGWDLSGQHLKVWNPPTLVHLCLLCPPPPHIHASTLAQWKRLLFPTAALCRAELHSVGCPGQKQSQPFQSRLSTSIQSGELAKSRFFINFSFFLKKKSIPSV